MRTDLLFLTGADGACSGWRGELNWRKVGRGEDEGRMKDAHHDRKGQFFCHDFSHGQFSVIRNQHQKSIQEIDERGTHFFVTCLRMDGEGLESMKYDAEEMENDNGPAFGSLRGCGGGSFSFVRRHCLNQEDRIKLYGTLDLCTQPREEGF